VQSRVRGKISRRRELKYSRCSASASSVQRRSLARYGGAMLWRQRKTSNAKLCQMFGSESELRNKNAREKFRISLPLNVGPKTAFLCCFFDDTGAHIFGKNWLSTNKKKLLQRVYITYFQNMANFGYKWLSRFLTHWHSTPIWWLRDLSANIFAMKRNIDEHR